MTPRTRFVVYLTIVHVAVGAVGLYLLESNPYWLFAVEGAFAASLLTGIGLTRSMFRHLQLAHTGLQMLEDRDFMSRFAETGQPDIDALVKLYNRMVDSLRDERTRLQEQHHFLSDILRVSPSGIVVLDFDERIASVNPAAERLLDCPEEALASKRQFLARAEQAG